MEEKILFEVVATGGGSASSSEEDSVSLLTLSSDENLLIGRERTPLSLLLRTGCSFGGVGSDCTHI